MAAQEHRVPDNIQDRYRLDEVDGVIGRATQWRCVVSGDDAGALANVEGAVVPELDTDAFVFVVHVGAVAERMPLPDLVSHLRQRLSDSKIDPPAVVQVDSPGGEWVNYFVVDLPQSQKALVLGGWTAAAVGGTTAAIWVATHLFLPLVALPLMIVKPLCCCCSGGSGAASGSGQASGTAATAEGAGAAAVKGTTSISTSEALSLLSSLWPAPGPISASAGTAVGVGGVVGVKALAGMTSHIDGTARAAKALSTAATGSVVKTQTVHTQVAQAAAQSTQLSTAAEQASTSAQAAVATLKQQLISTTSHTEVVKIKHLIIVQQQAADAAAKVAALSKTLATQGTTAVTAATKSVKTASVLSHQAGVVSTQTHTVSTTTGALLAKNGVAAGG
eukprot:Hpha_TRINITY_DN12209_c0_g1::TRINITY_DN12209_c0_g1_i1::g.16953::m.16953